MALSMVTPGQVTEKIRSFIVDAFLFGDAGRMPADDASLLQHEALDSTDVLELIVFLEETFNIQVEDSDVVRENFDTVAGLANFVLERS